MNDQQKTNYFKNKLNQIKSDKEEPGKEVPAFSVNKNNVAEKVYKALFFFLSFYGTQYIIIDKIVNSVDFTLNLFEASVIFIFLTLLLKKNTQEN